MSAVEVKVYPVGASGNGGRKPRSNWEPETVRRYERYSCPQCGAPMSALYARRGYVCDNCADIAEGKRLPRE